MADTLTSDGARLDTRTLEFIIHHTYLPPRLPQKDDTNGQHLLAMTHALRDSVSNFMAVEPRSFSSVQPALAMLDRFLRTNPAPNIGMATTAHRLELRSVISGLNEGDLALLHLRDQNAGLLLTCRQDSVLFEIFELLAPNQNVMSCEGSLLRNFPDRAVEVPLSKLQDTALLDVLVDAILELEFTIAPAARPKVTKAGSIQPEERDTLSPIFATGLFTDVLVGLGQEAQPKLITKRSREQVCWSHVSLPFHRSATWLLLRVALRLVLDRLVIPNDETSWYKPLMAYHHARIVDLAGQASQPPISSDTLFSMLSKVARRIVKLDPAEATSSGWLSKVRETVTQVRDTLGERRANELDRDNQTLSLDQFSELSFRPDSDLKLKTLRRHLSWIESRHVGQQNDRGEGDTMRFYSLSNMELPSLSRWVPADAVVDRCELIDFETWVESSLPGWTDTYHDSPIADLSSLKQLMEEYYKRASAVYDGIPAALSVMYLVVMELWVAMDKIAGKEVPLLLDYDPGFRSDTFHPLLLERRKEMERLHVVESHISSRRARAPNSYPSAFQGFGCHDSFAVRFYRSSPEHQRLRQEIEAWGSMMQTEKRKEYERMRSRYCELEATYNSRSCDYYWHERRQERLHSCWCNRCQLKAEMENLKIDVFEWPLPAISSHADAAVFEIDVPPIVVLWRDETWRLVTEVLSEKTNDRGAQVSLYFAADRGGMRKFYRTSSNLQPASTVKPMEVTHYRTKRIPDATPGNICVQHAAEYEYYDRPLKVSTEKRSPAACVPRNCSYGELVMGLPMEVWVRHTKHTSNDVIADQHRCPSDLSLAEFKSFGNMRSGVDLQWANVLCQLVIPSLDFNKTRTFSLILQACLEVGPQPEYEAGERTFWREAHVDTQKEPFMGSIISALRDALLRAQASWQNNTAICILTCLSTRLLSLSPSAEISSLLLDYLRQLREVSITWARLLRDKLNESDNDLDRQKWINRLLLAALTCGATFSMEAGHLEESLKDPDNLHMLAETTMLTRNHLPPSGAPADAVALQLMQRWHIVMYRARHFITREVIDQRNAGLDRAVQKFWAGYSHPSAGWTLLEQDAQSHILTCKSGSVSITFNLLTGHFFLNGYPLSKLPSAYQTHQTFRELFGQQILDVGPSSVPGMEFSASRDQKGWILHFAMKDGQLVVRAVWQRLQEDGDFGQQDGVQGNSWEYIPREQLTHDLPNSFISDYAHWFHLSTGVVEFRPIDSKWDSAMENWRLAPEDHRYTLRKGTQVVLDPSSRTAMLSHGILSSIETSGNINIILDCDDNSLALELPRFSLSFQARQGGPTISSMNYSGMQIDKTQGIGSLVGLVNKLVLKPERGPGFRMVLVPRGKVSPSLTKEPSHVNLHMDCDNGGRIRHDAFLVDNKLGRLVDTGSLQSKLYLCWLHAITSHCLPDSLTSRTGTEEALRVLRGAAVRSYPTLDNDSFILLGEIAQLSPSRTYYPPHTKLEVMEQTVWSDAIPPLSQHDDFWPLSTSIYDDYKKLGQLFEPSCWGPDYASAIGASSRAKRSTKLADRARIRNAIFRVSEFGGEGHTTTKDTWYHPRGRVTAIGCKSWVSRLARRIDSGAESLLFEPSTRLSKTIQHINGSNFSGNPEVTVGFDLDANLKGLWCGLHRALAPETNKYKKIFFLSSLLYAETSDEQMVQTLMALSNISVFAQADMLPPDEPAFDLNISLDTLRGKLKEDIRADEFKKSLEECPESMCWRERNESFQTFEDRQQRWKSNSERMVCKFVDELMTQVGRSWTVRVPTNENYNSYLHVDRMMPIVRALVETARRSEAFLRYLNTLSGELGRVPINVMENHDPAEIPAPAPTPNRPFSKPGFIPAASLFSQPAPHSDRPRPDAIPMVRTERGVPEQDHTRLSVLIDQLSAAENLQNHQASYIDELRRSMASPAAPQHVASVPEGALSANLQRARDRYDSTQRNLQLALTGTSVAHQVCSDAGVYPRISPIFLLQRLSRDVWTRLPQPWRGCLVDLAIHLVHLQRAERLESYSSLLPQCSGDLQRELSNQGDHENPEWDPLEYPESLLLEIEQGITIRSVQNKIAAVMRSPPGMRNSVMQLNMGEGKSSVLVPTVAVALARGDQLVRVVVAKPQSSQMTHILIRKLGGLINRRVFYLPFSRSTQLSRNDVAVIREIVEKCRAEGGLLLAQPEHLLSFKLMGIDKSWAAAEDKGPSGDVVTLGQDITTLYRHFESISRDIVDESDENFSVKFELIYTMGAQEAVEMGPDRWILIQQLLDMAENVVRRLTAGDATDTGVKDGFIIEDHGAGSVPIIRILEDSAGRHFVAELAAEVCRYGVRSFPIPHQTERMRQAILSYISVDQVSGEDIALVEDDDTGIFMTQTAKNALLLLRGLLAKGVILFALGQKRFRVNYGLAPARRPQTMLAVPYRAKDMPSPRSEFSHPDVVIVLTCLSYYYNGLSDEQLYTCLRLLNDSDQAEQEYGSWASRAPHLSPSFQHVSSINLEDKPQCEKIVFPALRYARPVVDFYLSRVVFPKEMKQFPLKLSSSGWDLARPKQHPLTGFSGTNDSKGVLPLSVAALDLQPHTNAAVLSTILGDENAVLEVGTGQGSRLSALSEEMLLGVLQRSEPQIRVILDVGAQIIESSNSQMARKMLNSAHVSSADAVVFFSDHDDELSVLTRNGDIVPFFTSPFTTRTDRCLVFLDQAHTRGTDLSLPDNYRAAVTLGPGVTKDALVQACMRMRKLGRGQSVAFLVSPEMQKRIRAVRSAACERPLTVADIIAWAITETWDEAVRSVPLWATQGVRYIRQEAIWEKAKGQGGVFTSSHAREYLEPEAMCLEERYRPSQVLAGGCEEMISTLMANLGLEDNQPGSDEAPQHNDTQISAIRDKLLAFSYATSASSISSTLQEEQERELSPEIEEEREVARPLPLKALPHSLTKGLEQFVRTGYLEVNSQGFRKLFSVMSTTSAASLFRPGLSAFPGDLLVTEDFMRTVEESGPQYRSDSYQRGAQWVLVSSMRSTMDTTPGESTARMVLISPWEANRLKRLIEKLQRDKERGATASGAAVTLHAYLPRPSLTFRSMEHLKTYSVPAVAVDWEAPSKLVMQLNLFAGQLYLHSFDEYKRVCKYLGLSYTENKDQEMAVPPDGFVGKRKYPMCEFEGSPVAFLAKVYNEIRNDCVGGMEKTHMGKILAGEILTERNF